MMPCGYTPLCCATQRGIVELVQVCIEVTIIEVAVQRYGFKSNELEAHRFQSFDDQSLDRC